MGSIWPLAWPLAWTLGRLAPLAVKLHPRRQFRIANGARVILPPPQAAKRQTPFEIRAPRRCIVRRLFVATMQPAPPRAAHSRRAAPRPVALHGRASRRIETRAGHWRHCHCRRTGPLGRAFPLHLDESRRPRRRLDHRRGISAPNRRTLGRRPTQRPHPRLIPGPLCPRDVAPHAPAVVVAHIRPSWPVALAVVYCCLQQKHLQTWKRTLYGTPPQPLLCRGHGKPSWPGLEPRTAERSPLRAGRVGPSKGGPCFCGR